MARRLGLCLVLLAACSSAPSPGDASAAIRRTLSEGKAPTKLVGAFNYVDVPIEIDRVEIVEIGDPVTISYMNQTYYPVRARVAYRFEDGMPPNRRMRPNVHDGDYQLWRDHDTWHAEFWGWSVKPSYADRLGPQAVVHNEL